MAEALPVLVVGDVHGDLQRLFAALRSYPDAEWRTVFLGDLVDGGPFGVGVLRYARDRANSTVLLGNHEVLLLSALADRGSRGPALTSWLAVGGQIHDLDELARDPGLQGWIRSLPALLMLEDLTLAQHTDSDRYLDLIEAGVSDPVPAINAAVRAHLESEPGRRRLWDLMTPARIFRDQPARLESWLARTGARRVVHGHTPHRGSHPDSYHRGRAICFDGGLGRHGGGRYRRASPATASVAPLPKELPGIL